MGLDITITQRKKNICPHCGKVTGYSDVCSASSGGRGWYPFLELIGYYVPYELRTEENDWYGKDMALTKEQANHAYHFVKDEEIYNWREIRGLIAVALVEKDDIVVNADW
jgi:hypothetical protein